MHLLWQSLAINNCSAYVNPCSSSGISPIQRPFARAKVGTFVLSRESAHIGQTLLHAGAKIGPLNSLTGSEPFDLAFLVTPSAFSKLTFSTSALPLYKLESICHKQHNQFLQTHLEKCQHKNLIQYSDIILQKVEKVETQHLFWTCDDLL